MRDPLLSTSHETLNKLPSRSIPQHELAILAACDNLGAIRAEYRGSHRRVIAQGMAQIAGSRIPHRHRAAIMRDHDRRSIRAECDRRGSQGGIGHTGNAIPALRVEKLDLFPRDHKSRSIRAE